MPNTAPSRDPKAFLAQWGFATQASEALQAHAELCSQYFEYPADDIVVGLALFSPEQVEEAMATRPANVLPLPLAWHRIQLS